MLIPLLAAIPAGDLVRIAGDAEGRVPTGGVVPILTSAILCLLLWVTLWRASRGVARPPRLVLAALTPFVIGATAGVVWATYAVAPGAALAGVLVAIAVALTR